MAEDFSSLGQIIFGCMALVSAGFGIYQFLGKQWVETKFAEAAAKTVRDHKAVVAKLLLEVESLRAAKKLQDLDFAALPGTWECLEKAYSGVRALLKFGEYKIDVAHLTAAELGEMTSTMEWFQSEINLVKSLDGYLRQEEFDNIRFRYQLQRIQGVCLEFREFVAANSIFYPAEMLRELNYFGATLQDAISAKERVGIRGKEAEKLATPVTDAHFVDRINAMATSIRKKLASHEKAAL